MVDQVFVDDTIKKLIEKYRVIWAIGHAQALMGWDSETYMPREGAKERSVARAELSVLSQQLVLRPELVELLEEAKKKVDSLNPYEKGVVRVLDRAVTQLKKLPPEHVYEYTKVTGEAVHVWVEAKQKSDFSKFKPYLEKIVDLARKTAEYLGYEKHPYNALLDIYEEGLTIDDMDRVFDAIIPHSKKVLEKVLSDGYYPSQHPLEKVSYDREKMEKVNKEILDLLGFPWDRARLDVSPHPFTVNMGVKDVRITTRYEGINFKHTIYSVIHEFGHALYELQVDEKLAMTPIAGGVSLGVHESQSRFWENIVGRSMPFVTLMKPILDKYLDFTREYSAEEIYRYVNTVRPSLIRVEADEVTYNFHIYLRYEIEKKLITGELNVDEVPVEWNNMMEKLLGIRPRNDAEGVLQDIHWSHGTIGYFPTYTLGNVIAAQIKQTIESKEKLEELLSQGTEGITRLKDELRKLVHMWGSTYPPKELIKIATGEEVNPEYFNQYLSSKYLK
ncbi:MAG: carboxypeptidase M32 [Desulfurococcales archaeon]|nr:carboxypeptidase M32 [Desulfurococcales archaeon]MEB3788716.1 carboxypeptidase M32 [Desulfurococcales archaeon]